MRRPHWRNQNESNWGFFKVKVLDIYGDALFCFRMFFDPLKNHLQKKKIEKALQVYPKRKLVIGSGKELPEGWIGFDRYKSGDNVFSVNLMFEFPINNNSIEAILAEHIFEHFYLDDVVYVLDECYRVMRKDGVIRIVCPDACNIARLIMLGRSGENDYDVEFDSKIHKWPDDGMRWARTINQLSHQWGEHKCLLTADMMESILLDVGFKGISILGVKESRYFPQIPDMHSRRFPDESENTSFVIEARK